MNRVIMKANLFAVSFASILFLPTSNAFAAGKLVIYCSTTNSVCEAQGDAFAKKYDVETSFIHLSQSNALAKIDAERKKPHADIWYGGSFKSQLQASEMSLLLPYYSHELKTTIDHFKYQAPEIHYVSVVDVNLLGFGINTERLAQKGLPLPVCWNDLTKPIYKDEIETSYAHSTYVSYTALVTLVQLWGEEKAFSYIQKLNKNIHYTKSATTPSRDVINGNVTIGIGSLHDYSVAKSKGAPIELISPCEGTSYESDSVSIIKNAPNVENAKLFVDWILSKEGQEITWREGKFFPILTNEEAEQSPHTLDPSEIKLIDLDVQTYNSQIKRKQLLERLYKNAFESKEKDNQ